MIDNRAYERILEKQGYYTSDVGKKQHRQKNHWPRPMELDATSQGRRQPSKEVMDKRRRDKLCFECGLPGHIASSHNKGPSKPWSGKKKQLNVTGRGGYHDTREICATHSKNQWAPAPDGKDSSKGEYTYWMKREDSWIYGKQHFCRTADI
jgi:hypothetical protein